MNLKLGADVVSYAATKKSTNDNLASAITEKDCDTLNLLDDKSYCVTKVVYDPPSRNGLKVTWRKSDVMERDTNRNVATTNEELKSQSTGNRVLLATHGADRPRSGLHKNIRVRSTKVQIKSSKPIRKRTKHK